MTPLLVVIGPSGSGKSAVVRELRRLGAVTVTPTWTSRPRRPDETGDTVEHRFVTEREFDDLERQGFFLEVVRAFGLPYRYGVPRVSPTVAGRAPVLMARAPFLPLVRRHFPDHVVYQIEESFERARARVMAREAAGADLGTRLRAFEEERWAGRRGANRIFTNDGSLDALVAAVERAMQEDLCEGAQR